MKLSRLLWELFENITLINSTFTGNKVNGTSGTAGGAGFSNNQVSVDNSSFINNTALNGSGRAVYANNTVTIVNGSEFINNTAKSGGAVTSALGNITVNDTEFVKVKHR